MFVKLFTQILDSSIADDRRLRHFFTDFLLCADMKGFVMMTESAISRRIGASLDEVKWGIEELMKPDSRSKTLDFDGRRIEPVDGSGYGWRIINFETYRALKSADDMREKTRERVRKFRAKSKDSEPCNADVTPCNAGNTRQKQRQKAETETTKNVAFAPSPLQSRLNALFKRRDSTKWSSKELKAFKQLEITEEEMQLVEKFHATPGAYKRQGLQTLLNNWNEEVDRARNVKTTNANEPAPNTIASFAAQHRNQ
jgi:hypothetical protein